MAIVRFNLTLIEQSGGLRELKVDEEQPVPLTEVLNRVGVPLEEVGIIVKNRKTQDIDCMIEKEDVVELFPILSGG